MQIERHHHDPKSDEVPEVLGEALRAVQPYAKLIVGGLIAVVAVFSLTQIYRSRIEKKRVASWSSLSAAMETGDPEEFAKVAENYPESEAAMWGLVQAGYGLIREAIRLDGVDKAGAQAAYKQARDTFEKTAELTSTTMVRQRAMLGLAQAHQGMGEFSEAVKVYNDFMKEWAGTEMAEIAKERLDAIQMPSTRQFYAWYREQKPRLPVPPVSDPASPFSSSLNDPAGVRLPSASDLTRPADENAFGPVVPPDSAVPNDEPASNNTDLDLTPAAGTEPATGESPAETPSAEAPASDQPESGEPSATEQPAEGSNSTPAEPAAEPAATEAPTEPSGN